MGLRDGHDCSAAQCRRLTLLASAEAKAAHDACWAARPGLRVCGYAEASGRTLKDVATRPRRFQRSERRPAPGPAGRSGPTRDVTAPPDLWGARPSRAGPVRSRRPVYVDLLPPCNSACPAGENIQSWLALVEPAATRRHGRRSWPTILFRLSMAASAITLAKPAVTAPSSTAPCPSIRSSVFSETCPGAGLEDTSTAGSDGLPGARRRSGPERIVGRVPPCATRSPGRDP